MQNMQKRRNQRMKTAGQIRRGTKMHYYDLQRNWTRKIVPHLNDEALNTILVRDFNNYCIGRWNETFKPGQLPEDVESCDWRDCSGRRGRLPRYWSYVKHGACYWIVNFALCLASLAEPNTCWRIVTSDEHATVWDGRETLFEFNFQALGISAEECWQLARYGKNCEILSPGVERILGDPLPWSRNGVELPVGTGVTLDDILRREKEEASGNN
jgi:hypothetical protein